MKKGIKGLVAFATCFAILLNLFCVAGFASENNDMTTPEENLNVSIIIKERNGVNVKDFFFRRGIALEKGKYHNVSELSLTYNGEKITSSVEVLQKYDDGSI